MAGRQRCEQTTTKKTSRRGDVASSAIAEDSDCTTLVCQATSKPVLELARLRQAEEGRVSPTVGRRTRESSPMASRYFLRNTRARTCRWVTQVGPGVRLTTSPTKASATRTGSGRDVSRGDRRRDGNSGSGPSSAHVRKVQTPAQRARRTAVRRSILSGQGTDRFGTFNVQMLRGLGKLE